MYVDVEQAAEPPPAWPCWAVVDPGRSVIAPAPAAANTRDMQGQTSPHLMKPG
jgi:hypothetical protein